MNDRRKSVLRKISSVLGNNGSRLYKVETGEIIRLEDTYNLDDIFYRKVEVDIKADEDGVFHARVPKENPDFVLRLLIANKTLPPRKLEEEHPLPPDNVLRMYLNKQEYAQLVNE